MAVDRAVDLAQRHKIIHGHSFSLAVRKEGDTEVGAGGVDDWHRMALGQHQAICAGIARLLRSPAHRVIHQRGDQMRKRERAGGMAAACGRGGADRELGDGDRLGVNELAQRCHGALLDKIWDRAPPV